MRITSAALDGRAFTGPVLAAAREALGLLVVMNLSSSSIGAS
jgi:hypothetical protein